MRAGAVSERPREKLIPRAEARPFTIDGNGEIFLVMRGEALVGRSLHQPDDLGIDSRRLAWLGRSAQPRGERLEGFFVATFGSARRVFN
jgi:hypothetical protein